MLTYLLINVIFLGLIVLVLWRLKSLKINWLIFGVLAVLLVCTAFFDSLIIMADIVRYDVRLISGLMVWRAPVEDFFYSLVAALLIPAVWYLSNKRGQNA